MINIYRYSEVATHKASVDLLLPGSVTQGEPFSLFPRFYTGRTALTMVPIPSKLIPTEEILNNGRYELRLPTEKLLQTKMAPTICPTNKVYIHSCCNISRAQVTQKYTRVIKPSKADICVVPNNYTRGTYQKTLIFANKITGCLYYIVAGFSQNPNISGVVFPDEWLSFPLGTTAIQINPQLSKIKVTGSSHMERYIRDATAHLQTFAESQLIFSGYSCMVSNKELWFADAIYNNIHDIVYDTDILPTLGDANNELNKDLYSSLKDMLTSTNIEIVGLGLKTLAELDYTKYCNTVKYLLCGTGPSWRYSTAKNSSTVKYMLNTLDLWKYDREVYTPECSVEDFNLMQEIIAEEVKTSIDRIIDHCTNRYPFANIHADYSVSIEHKQPEEPEEDTN